ncbi:MAG: 4Fe-4S ferredoxin [Spirochaetales bacterium]|nr:4Fe-4S ferredoxin [Spirochaetales bacterium]
MTVAVVTNREVRVLKCLLLIYILLGLIIAGLNFGWAPQASAQSREVMLAVWQIYENQFKTVLIVVCSLLTLAFVRKREIPRMRRFNLLGFASAALVVHVAGPLLTGNPDLYFFAMPLPWSTVGLRLAAGSSTFYREHLIQWGARGVGTALVFFAAIHGIVLTGTLLAGRRWQCSTICLFNGFASEVFDPAFPLIGRTADRPAGGPGRLGRGMLRFLMVMRWVLLGFSLVLTFFWLGIIVFDVEPPLMYALETFERYKYLVVELLLAMVFWTVLVGRGYCYYCPVGTVLAWVGRAAGQKILTTKGRCIGCGKCDSVCPMSIRIRERALEGQPVVDLRCVGCCHCVDACPVHALEYSTAFLRRFGGRR